MTRYVISFVGRQGNGKGGDHDKKNHLNYFSGVFNCRIQYPSERLIRFLAQSQPRDVEEAQTRAIDSGWYR